LVTSRTTPDANHLLLRWDRGVGVKREAPVVHRAAILLVTLFAFGLAACGAGGSSEAPKDGSYVGKVDGTDAYIALVTGSGKVAGYICDSANISVWIPAATVSGNSASLVSRKGVAVGPVTWSGSTASGTVTIDGTGHAFTAQLASGDAGLYRAVQGTPGDAGAVEVGWVVLPDGSQRGTITSFTNPIGSLAAPKLDTSSTSVNITTSSFSGSLVVNQFTDPIHNL
jgi:hypothetical protein